MSADALIVICLCAEWCGVCREYREGFDALARRHDHFGFHWADIEDEADWPDALDIESFPTVLVQRGEHVLFLGPTLPQHTHLARMLESLSAMDEAEAARYVMATEERRGWQQARDFARRIAGVR
jgi:thiol-disulfide isomerase/thioredoxin